MKRLLVVVLSVLILSPGIAEAAAVEVSWLPAGPANMKGLRNGTLLGNGQVLLFRGDRITPGANLLEIFDPATDTFTVIGSDVIYRINPAGVRLPDGGVLVTAGGTTSAIRYHPADGSGLRTADSLEISRDMHQATLLPNGTVLVTGGFLQGGVDMTRVAEVYDPATDTWTTLANQAVHLRGGHTATLLPNGKVLLAGGADTASAEEYDPATGQFALVANMTVSRRRHTATLLPNGKVLIAGGYLGTSGLPHDTAELYDPATQQFTAVPGTMQFRRAHHSATLLASGNVLFVGGQAGTSSIEPPVAGVEIYDPVTNAFSPGPAARYPRNSHAAVRLDDGRVLVAAGFAPGSPGSSPGVPETNTAELFHEPPARIPRTDANFDRFSDILWRRNASFQNVLWFGRGATTTSAHLPTRTSNWTIATVGDFDASGTMDIFWRDPSTGANEFWLMDGATPIVTGTLTTINAPGWQVAGSGDFNGDRRQDVVWRKQGTGETVLWLMNGAAGTLDGRHIPGIPDTNWSLGAIGDFNGDGLDDLLWRNAVTGENVIWQMSGFNVTNGSHILTQPDASYTLAGADDFNDDHKSDLVWRNDATGETVIWLIDGFSVTNGAHIATLPNNNWRLAAIGDYDHSGQSDILWRNIATNEVAVWFLDDFVVTGGATYGVVDPTWDLHWR